MYSYINGIIEDIDNDVLVLDCNGIGYNITATAAVFNKYKIGDRAKIYVYQAVREDAITLYGFSSKDEKSMFLRLITVSGIGPKMGVQILSGITAQELALALVTGDTAALTQIPGIGKKTAQRLILELKEKVDNDELLPKAGVQTGELNNQANEAISALIALGIQRSEAVRAVNSVQGQANSVEEIIRLVLRGMDKTK